MFDSAFRTLFLSTPAKLRLENNHLCITQEQKENVKIPLSDILCIILESHQITFTNSLLNAFAYHKIVVFTCDEHHLPSGIFIPFLGHYKSLSILQSQIALSKQRKAILWQQIIKSKINNQASLLKMLDKDKYTQLESLSKSVNLSDSSNNEAKAAAIYFKSLFGRDFSRKIDLDNAIGTINAALNYGYAIVRGVITRVLCASGLNPVLGLFHCNQFNSFNLADDLIEPYRIFVDSLVFHMKECGDLGDNLGLADRLKLTKLLNASILIDSKIYPLNRAVVISVQSLVKSFEKDYKLKLPLFEENKSNGREVYESISYV
ncbi:type II CRISPR-associated endonuclease Cas1 [Helicobacter muridarum]|uniref:CRISPR-associated endonuclease Cas1 n=1 Tax=Helicobacter muridarum TaxID=216 RepID=A0A377PU70_9HELI|nr:type II CRISPR-associated endonuclease Cas1 [Helicobacter muridarum]TLE01090.1 type II CRISPR-associated endonuclease Cas1 [Helicobacter muridarum]STQ85952.1 CRISPR associated protein [Helicobacter muridarum]